MNESLLLHIYLVDEMATIHEMLTSEDAAKLIIRKGYRFFTIADEHTDGFEFTRAYVKDNSIAVMSIHEINEIDLIDLFNKIIFKPHQIKKEYNRIIRKKNSKYPVFTEISTDILVRHSCKETPVKMVFSDDEIIKRTTVKGIDVFREIDKLKGEYYDKYYSDTKHCNAENN